MLCEKDQFSPFSPQKYPFKRIYPQNEHSNETHGYVHAKFEKDLLKGFRAIASHDIGAQHTQSDANSPLDRGPKE